MATTQIATPTATTSINQLHRRNLKEINQASSHKDCLTLLDKGTIVSLYRQSGRMKKENRCSSM